MPCSLDPALIRAVIRTESAFDALAVSRAGAQGLMQLMSALALELGAQTLSNRAKTTSLADTRKTRRVLNYGAR